VGRKGCNGVKTALFAGISTNMTVNLKKVVGPGDRIVSMVEHQGALYVATEHRVYRFFTHTPGAAFEPVMFYEAEEVNNDSSGSSPGGA
jgi:hypothetical protein